jgi:Protein of unknown function (DUF2971)
MWGHYCDGHNGFCLEFDTDAEPMFTKAKQVQYADAVPSLGVETFTKADFAQMMKLLLTKAKCWEYEREWRVLHEKGELAYGYDRASLTGVYFGAKMSDERVQMISSLLDATDTKFYRMQVSKTSFELTAEPFTFDRIDYRKATKSKT